MSNNNLVRYDRNTRRGAIKCVPSNIYSWGDYIGGGGTQTGTLQPSSVTNIVSLVCNNYAVSVLDYTDGHVAGWGDPVYGGIQSLSPNTNIFGTTSSNGTNSNITRIFANDGAFFGITTDSTNNFRSWGKYSYGAGVASFLVGKTIIDIYTVGSYVLAIDSNKTAYVWTNVSLNTTYLNVVSVQSSLYSFAILNSSGIVYQDGNTITFNMSTLYPVGSVNTGGVIKLFSTTYAFAALKADGTVFTWGKGSLNVFGGQLSVELTNIVNIYSSDIAFTSIDTFNTIYSWGTSVIYSYDGDGSGNPILTPASNTNVIYIQTTNSSFAALKNDGTVIIWGNPGTGGVVDGSADAKKIYYYNDNTGGTSQNYSSITSLTNIRRLYSNYFTFIAEDLNGKKYMWGGGSAYFTNLNSYIKIYSGYTGFIGINNFNNLIAMGAGTELTTNALPTAVPSGVTANVICMVMDIIGHNRFFALAPMNPSTTNIDTLTYTTSSTLAYSNRDRYYLTCEPRIYPRINSNTNNDYYTNTLNYLDDLSIFRSIVNFDNTLNNNWLNGLPFSWYNGTGIVFSDRSLLININTILSGTNYNVIIIQVECGEIFEIQYTTPTSVTNKYFRTDNYLYNVITSGGTTYTKTSTLQIANITYNVLVGHYGIVLYKPSIYCFYKGTFIKTTKGNIKIENLTTDDKLISGNGRILNIQKINNFITDDYSKRPYVINRSEYGYDNPMENLYITENHAVKINNIFYHPIHNFRKEIKLSELKPPYDYYHIETDDYFIDTVIANNMECETYANQENMNLLNWDCTPDGCFLSKK